MGYKIMTYIAMKKIIESGGYDKEEVLWKLDIFLVGNRITIEQYNELKKMMNDHE
jgi:hypothetical protein